MAKKVKGESGTKVKLEIIRSGKHIEKTITRKKVNGTVFSEIKGDTAKIELTTFAETSGDEFGRHLEDIKKARWMRRFPPGHMRTRCSNMSASP